MAAPVSATPVRVGRGLVAAVLTITLSTGYVVARSSVPFVHSRYFPWIVGRTLGLAAYAYADVIHNVGTAADGDKVGFDSARADVDFRAGQVRALAEYFVTFGPSGWLLQVMPR